MGVYTGPGLTVPVSFKVNEGSGGRVIVVQGPLIRVEPPLRRGQSFSIQQAAGLTVRRPRGRSFENILYDVQGKTLCRFTAGEKNGQVFLQYLRNQGVPFYRSDGRLLEPVPTSPEGGKSICCTDMEKIFGPRFTLQLRRTAPIGVWIALGTVLGLLLFLFGFPAVAILSGPRAARNLNILLALILFLAAGPWVLALVKGQLFPPVLTVEGDRMRISAFGGWRELRPENVGGFYFQRSDECYILYDKQGRDMAKFSIRDAFGPQFMDFLTDHGITCTSEKPWSQPADQETCQRDSVSSR